MVQNLSSVFPMSKTPFRFKQFSIRQENSAMKVGTDGVLLGSWAEALYAKRILDIGTGTGLISLMLAQRFTNAEITGIEIDELTSKEASFNVTKSPFSKKCTIINTSLQHYNPSQSFDFIISNPPFFEFTNYSKSARNNARQQSELSFEELLFHTQRLLMKNGHCAFIIPYSAENSFIQLAKDFGLFPERILHIKGHEKALFKRSLLQFSFLQKEVETSTLTIELERNVYTNEYIQLTKDFYLKM